MTLLKVTIFPLGPFSNANLNLTRMMMLASLRINTVFENHSKRPFLRHFVWNVNVARFARNAEWDFMSDLQTSCFWATFFCLILLPSDYIESSSATFDLFLGLGWQKLLSLRCVKRIFLCCQKCCLLRCPSFFSTRVLFYTNFYR